MQKDERVYLAHMLNAAVEAQGYIAGKTRADYDADRGLRRQLERMVEIIGEAARLVPPSIREANPRIPWAAIVGMRHRIVHDYLHVDHDILWNTVTFSLPVLIGELDTIVPSEMRDAP